MKKVTTINLAGRAFQVEEPAYAAVNDYLETSRRALHSDPDQAEILNDLEQSIADKCAAKLDAAKEVITEDEMQAVLAALGPVEAANDDISAKDDAAATDDRSRRLYRIPEGAVLAGVCRGLAAYFDKDVRLFYAIFIVGTLLTHGFFILVYILMAIVLPKADNREKLAAAYGGSVTADKIIQEARRRGTGAAKAGGRLGRAILKIGGFLGLVGFVAGTVLWLLGLWVIAFGDLHFMGNLSHLNGWWQYWVLTAGYLSAALPLLIGGRWLLRLDSGRPWDRPALLTDGALIVVWLVACVGVGSLLLWSRNDFDQYANAHQGYLDVGSHHICIGLECRPDYRYCNSPAGRADNCQMLEP